MWFRLWRGLAHGRERYGLASGRAAQAGRAQVQGWARRLAALERLRQSLGYVETLKRGFAVVRGDTEVVTSRAAAERAAVLEIEFADGKLTVGGKPARRGRKDSDPPEQGSLF